ncbi:hypothetical protein L3556_05175 [Candidatus Synechococcus calcipolaris G9]|uniref:DUF7734 domain-containing protein n=1 Tax=Candidatus Synechococcus calcipolaris G9 TaxID=1497997 RepID=A0ABT6EX07_9SYNE|nr:hypothetical protein [Candidatus Synechococcus calcipolaris]MDG2990330.1 hypothetical protein [Candidatus Synechococcus calcipolaris G9]
MEFSPIQRLEDYTLEHPDEILLVTARITSVPGRDRDQVIIFKGFSSSLMGPTMTDVDLPVLPEDAVIESIDRMASPYDPDAPIYLEQGLTWHAFAERLP